MDIAIGRFFHRGDFDEMVWAVFAELPSQVPLETVVPLETKKGHIDTETMVDAGNFEIFGTMNQDEPKGLGLKNRRKGDDFCWIPSNKHTKHCNSIGVSLNMI